MRNTGDKSFIESIRNTYGLTKKVIYENEEFHLLQAALNIEDGLDGLRYNKIVIATDADVDGMQDRKSTRLNSSHG